MGKRKLPKSEPGHRERFDLLLGAMIPPMGLVKFDSTQGSATTISIGSPVSTSTTTQEQIDAYMLAVAEGRYFGF